MVGTDESSERIRADLTSAGVRAELLVHPSVEDSAACLCLITPDGQRTMRTCLAAAGGFRSASDVEAVAPRALAGASLAHFEGYRLFAPDALEAALHTARCAGARTSLDLASFEVVRATYPRLKALLSSGLVDVVLCNELEAKALLEEEREARKAARKAQGSRPRGRGAAVDWFQGSSGADGAASTDAPDAAAENASAAEGSSVSSSGDAEGSTASASGTLELPAFPPEDPELLARLAISLLHSLGASVAAVSLGPLGARAAAKGCAIATSSASSATVVDTVGAGDAFAGGFLYAVSRGASMRAALRAGCAAGTAVVSIEGGALPERDAKALREAVQDILDEDADDEGDDECGPGCPCCLPGRE